MQSENIALSAKILSLFGIQISIINIFVIAGLIFSLYAVWREGRKDGFSEERLFDNYIVSLLIALLFSRIFYAISARFLFVPFLQHVFYFWRPGLNFEGFLIGFIIGTFNLSFIYKWSLFRIFDIYSLALSFGGAVILLGVFAITKELTILIVVAVLLVFYGLFSHLRLQRLLSGITFIIFLNLMVLFRELSLFPGSGGLLFNTTLVTIGVFTLIFRLKKKMIIKRKLPIDLFSRLKEALQKKNKRLDKQQKLLDAEDPYMQAGRAEGNADEVDEAHLEDNFKTVVDAQKDVVGKISENVKKALGKMSKGDYGLCERCGAPIDPARLQAYPEATLCSDCARKEE